MTDSELKKLKTKYEKIGAKYKLPKFEDLDSEFEIRLIEDQHFLIKEVRRAILNRIRSISAFFLPVLDPHPSELHSLVEMGAFNSKEKDALFKFYKKLSYWMHRGITVSMISEEAEAKFINDLWKDWPELKTKARGYMEKITDEWLNGKKKEKEDIHYVG